MEIYLALDCETGGLSSVDHSLLTAYFAFCIEESPNKFKIIDELELSLLDSTGNYRTTPEAMAINKIDLVSLKENAINPLEASKLLFEKIQKHTDNGKRKLTLIGQNIPFDEKFITVNLIPKTIWEKYTYNIKLDTRELLKKAKSQGKIPKEQSLSLGSIANWFGIEVASDQLHGAKYDTLLCIQVLEKAMRI